MPGFGIWFDIWFFGGTVCGVIIGALGLLDLSPSRRHLFLHISEKTDPVFTGFSASRFKEKEVLGQAVDRDTSGWDSKAA